MVGSVREILKIKTVEDLQAAFIDLEINLEEKLESLEDALDNDILSQDTVDSAKHGSFVESWHNRVSKYLYLTSGFVEHAKSTDFLLSPAPGVTEGVRDAWKKKVSGPFVALQARLEHLLSSIDSRVNLVKKAIDNDQKGDRKRFAA